MEFFSIDLAVRWLHLVASVTWVGGLIFTNFVLTPPATGRGIPPAFIRLMCMQRFRGFALGSLAVLVATGIYNAWTQLSSAGDLLATTWGNVLLAKAALAATAITITVFNSLVLGPAVVANAPQPGPNQTGPSAALVRFEKYLVLFSQVNLVIAAVILYLALVLK